MYPNENQPAATPVDYLNQIAPKNTSKNSLFSNKIIFFGIIAIISLIVIMIIGSIFSNGGVDKSELLATRLNLTEKVADDATTKIKSSQLLSYNSELKIFLTNTISQLKPILSGRNINVESPSKSALSNESTDELMATLEDARLNAIYDRTYAREMAYRLEITLSLMQEVYSSTSDNALKSALTDAYNNLKPTQKSFADFNAANS